MARKKITIKRKGYCVKPTSFTKDGETTIRRGYCVRPSTFQIKDKGKKGVTSFGAKQGKRKGTKPLIKDKGSWGSGLLTKPNMTKAEMIRRAERKYNQELRQHNGNKSAAYRATIASLNILLRPRGMKEKYGKRINDLKTVVRQMYRAKSIG